ncbi:MAG: restriction endonuclease subunit S [Deltaproteobacteria bacterium]|nr:restriction endonuclease subunit S [Deltaproteobacteria bacterium]
MRERWQIKRIGDIAAIKPLKSEVRRRVSSDALVSFLPMEDLRITEKYACAARTRKFLDVVGSYTYFAEGDVLLAKITPCFENGKLGIAKGLKNGIGFGSSEFIVLRPDKTITNEWLYYFLSREDFKSAGAQRMGGAVGHQRVPQEFVENYPIPIPPLPEQQRLVSILDEAFAGIAKARVNAEKNLQNTRALFESYLQSIFTKRSKDWVETTLGAEVDILTGFPFKSARYTDTEKDVRLLRGDNIIQGELRWDDVKRWPAVNSIEYERYRLCFGDVVLAMDRPWVKAGLKRAQISPDDLPCLLVQRTARLRVKSNLNNRFLLYLISSDAFTTHILGVQTGIGVPHISGQQIKDFPFIRPSVKEQHHIIEKLDSLAAETQRLESIYQRKLAALEELKKSLLDQAFNGAL